MDIRTAKPSDAHDISALMADVIKTSTASFSNIPKTANEWGSIIEDRLTRERGFFVMELVNKVCGYATYDQFRPENDGYRYTMEHSIYLAPNLVGTGAGSELYNAIETHAQMQGHHSFIGAIDADNSRSIAFHTKRGFTEVGRIPKAGYKFGRWLDVIFLQKFL